MTDRVLPHPRIVCGQGYVGEEGVGNQDCHLISTVYHISEGLSGTKKDILGFTEDFSPDPQSLSSTASPSLNPPKFTHFDPQRPDGR